MILASVKCQIVTFFFIFFRSSVFRDGPNPLKYSRFHIILSWSAKQGVTMFNTEPTGCGPVRLVVPAENLMEDYLDFCRAAWGKVHDSYPNAAAGVTHGVLSPCCWTKPVSSGSANSCSPVKRPTPPVSAFLNRFPVPTVNTARKSSTADYAGFTEPG